MEINTYVNFIVLTSKLGRFTYVCGFFFFWQLWMVFMEISQFLWKFPSLLLYLYIFDENLIF